jgi:hypothetical protein
MRLKRAADGPFFRRECGKGIAHGSRYYRCGWREARLHELDVLPAVATRNK